MISGTTTPISHEQAILEHKKQLEDLKNGKTVAIKTPYNNLNKVTLNGFEKNTINIIGGRSGSGKVTYKFIYDFS